MNTTINIALLHLGILISQSFYMYLSNKLQMKKRWYMYVLAIPFVMIFPVILNGQSPEAYDLYEYAIVICIFAAAVVDVTFAVMDMEYLTDAAIRRFLYSYFFICMAAACSRGVSSWLRAIIVFALIGSFSVFNISKKHPVTEILKSLPLAILSYICSGVLYYCIF